MQYKSETLTQADIMKTPFLFTQAHKNDYFSMGEQALKGIQEESLLSRLFFSPSNYKFIQKMIKKAIIIASGKKYYMEDDQDEAELTIVMRGMFLQHARHLPANPQQNNNELKANDIDYINKYQFFFPIKYEGIKTLFSEETKLNHKNEYIYKYNFEDGNGKENLTLNTKNKKQLLYSKLVVQEVIELNWRVVDDVVPGIISEIRGQELYLRDKLQPYRIMERPENVSVKGIKGSIPSVTNIYQ